MSVLVGSNNTSSIELWYLMCLSLFALSMHVHFVNSSFTPTPETLLKPNGPMITDSFQTSTPTNVGHLDVPHHQQQGPTFDTKNATPLSQGATRLFPFPSGPSNPKLVTSHDARLLGWIRNLRYINFAADFWLILPAPRKKPCIKRNDGIPSRQRCDNLASFSVD